MTPPDTAAAQVVIYATGLIACSVCAPSALSVEEVENATNRLNPTGISSRWSVSTDRTFRRGGPNPGPCEQAPGERTHYLMVC